MSNGSRPRSTGSYQRLWLIAAAITGDRTEADDIVQDAALVALRKLGDFTAGTSFVAWMSQIVRLTALNHVRKSNRQSTLPIDPQTLDRVGSESRDEQRFDRRPWSVEMADSRSFKWISTMKC